MSKLTQIERVKQEAVETVKYLKHILKYLTEKSNKVLSSPVTQLASLAVVFNVIASSTISIASSPLAYDLNNLNGKQNIVAISDKINANLILIQYQEPLLVIPLDEAPAYNYAADTLPMPELKEVPNTFSNDVTSKIQWPFPHGVSMSSHYGERNIVSCKHCSKYHQGLDFTPGLGSGIQAVADGIVYETRNFDKTYLDTPEGSYGSYIIIRHNVDGIEFETLYAHLMFGSIAVNAGDKVKVGDFIGQVGATGIVTGPHLHFEIRIGGEKINPYPWLVEMNAKTSQTKE
jgi:murein DD-endopeptidase MepM/ murein hydrolase activator NlpD